MCAWVCVMHAESYLGLVSAGGMHFVCRKFLEAGVSSEGQCFTDERYQGQVWVLGFTKVMFCKLWLFQENDDACLHVHTHTYAHAHTCTHTHTFNFYQYNIFNITNENEA